MLHTKKRKKKLPYTNQKKKATSGTRGFPLHSKTIGKSMNSTEQIIRRHEENRTVLLTQFENGGREND